MATTFEKIILVIWNKKLGLKLKYFLLITKINKIIPLNHEEIVVAIGIIIKPIFEKKVRLIIIFIITDIKEYIKGVFVSFLANKKVENILIKENAGSPKEK